MQQKASASFDGILARWRGLIDAPVDTSVALEANLTELYRSVYLTDFEALDSREIATRGPIYADDLFDLVEGESDLGAGGVGEELGEWCVLGWHGAIGVHPPRSA